MTQYFADVLQKPTSSLDVPDLQAIAKDSNIRAILLMCRLTIAIGVHCENNKEFIEKIQELDQRDQHCLMKAIEQVRLTCPSGWITILTWTLLEGHGKDFQCSRICQPNRVQHNVRVRIVAMPHYYVFTLLKGLQGRPLLSHTV
jgi:hypothetical protein